ncbi:hypothetical protein [Peptoniphilus indolicus]|nr:hypothetical protein [Peptoniphilus indolicus]
MNNTNFEEDLKYRFSLMDKAGARMQIISATHQVSEYGSAKEALESAQMINNLYADMMKKYPDKFFVYSDYPYFKDEKIYKSCRIHRKIRIKSRRSGFNITQQCNRIFQYKINFKR